MKNKITTVNLGEKLNAITETWAPVIAAKVNDHHLKLAKLKGEFVWHHHEDSDEAFFVLKGKVEIHFRDKIVELSEGDFLVVPKGVEHKPVAEEECHIMLIEKKGTINTGNRVNEMTRFEERNL
jgi:mannose-6-phosphate isomerase-like protein (cupin superfamily)